MNKPPIVRIVIPTFKELEHVKSLSSALLKQDLDNFEAYFVNCNPGDETSSFLNELQDQRFIEFEGANDLFWTGAISLGMKNIRSANFGKDDIIMFLNSDVTFDKFFLAKMYEHTIRLNGYVHALTLGGGNFISSGVKIVSWLFCINQHLVRASQDNQPSEIMEADMLNGRAIAFPSKALISVGCVDDLNFPHYCGDWEYTARAKRAGFNLYVVHDVTVLNDGENTGIHCSKDPIWPNFYELLTSRKSTTNLKTRLNFIYRTYPKSTLICALPTQFIKVLVSASYFYLRQVKQFFFYRS